MKERTFRFEFGTRDRATHTKAQYIESLNDFLKERGGVVFTERDYDRWKKRVACTRTISLAFGSWAKAMEAAGLEPQWGKSKDYSRMVEVFMDCWEENHEKPNAVTFISYLKKHSYNYTISMYNNHFGGITRLAQRVIDYQDNKISANQLTEKYKRIGRARSPLSAGMRYLVMERDGFKCKICGKMADDGAKLEIDHIIPFSRGGKCDIDNLRTLCLECNRGKRDKTLTDI